MINCWCLKKVWTDEWQKRKGTIIKYLTTVLSRWRLLKSLFNGLINSMDLYVKNYKLRNITIQIRKWFMPGLLKNNSKIKMKIKNITTTTTFVSGYLIWEYIL